LKQFKTEKMHFFLKLGLGTDMHLLESTGIGDLMAGPDRVEDKV
jgi:hypothetical protein